MTVIDTTPFWTGQQAKKTKGLKAKPFASIFADQSVMGKFLLDTLEAKEVLTPDACFCIGEAGDAWQQAGAKLIKDYDLTSITADGWLVFHPKPTKIVEFFEVTEEVLDAANVPATAPSFIVGLWGQTIDGIANLQRCRLGDFVARQLDVHEDQWVVQRAIWQRTYTAMP